jgi:flagella basal body P-ring formation protein FlgA
MRRAVILGLFLWLALSGTVGFAQTTALVLEIPAQVTVAGPKIFLADLGQLKGASQAERDFWSRFELGLAPLPGRRRYFTRNYLEFVLKQHKNHRRPVLRMGTRVAVKVAAVAVEGPAIAAAVDSLMPPPTPGVVKQWVKLTNLPEAVWLPRGKWRVEAALVAERLVLGINIFKIKLIGATESRTFNLTGVYRKIAMVYRANRKLPAKAEVTAVDFSQIEKQLESEREYSGDFPKGYRTVRTIRAGQLLFSDSLQPLPQVCKDSEVRVIYREGDIVIMITGIAKQDGWDGDLIAVVNSVSKKKFQGRVVGPGTVEVR